MRETVAAGLTQKHRTRVLVVDDHPLVRQALKETLSREPGLEVCGEAEDREGTLAAIKRFRPHLAIVDLGLKDSDGITLIKEIRELHPQMLTLVLSMHDETLYAERAIRAGASGYISKREAPTKLLEAVRKILGGEIYWSEKVAAQVASKVARSVRGSEGSPADRLSERELEVFELIGSGASTPAIGAMLRIDASTVETYRARIKEKMGLRNAGELLQSAIRWSVAKGGCRQLPRARDQRGGSTTGVI